MSGAEPHPAPGAEAGETLEPGGESPMSTVAQRPAHDRAHPLLPSGAAIVAVAIVLGLLSDRLVRGGPPGAGMTIWLLALLAAGAVLARRLRIRLLGEGRWLMAPVAVFALLICWRASEPLVVLNLLGLLVLLALVAWRARRGTLRRARVADYLWGAARTGLGVAVGLPLLTARDAEWSRVAGENRVGQATAAIRGALLALPVLLLFGSLLVSADPAFERLLDRLFRWDLEGLAASALWILLWSWLAAGWLRSLLLAGAGGGAPEGISLRSRLGTIELGVVLGLVNLLFLLFVLVQFRYLFGGAALVESTPGVGYADYARSGFFELVAVSALAIPLLLACHAARGETPKDGRLYRTLAGGMTGLLLVMLLSAADRMRLYLAAYGLTEERVYASVFLGWIAAVLVWFLATVLREREERFIWGTLVAGIAALLLLNVVSPAALVVRVNVARAEAGAELDLGYLATLGPDAWPALLEVLPGRPVEERCVVETGIAAGSRERVERRDWRSWSVGRERAREALRERGEWLPGEACHRVAARAPAGAERPRPAPRR